MSFIFSNSTVFIAGRITAFIFYLFIFFVLGGGRYLSYFFVAVIYLSMLTSK